MFNSTYATPRMIGNVNVDELVGFSHAAELLLGAQVLPPSTDELVVVAALRGSTTRVGTAILIIDSILPTISDSAAASRGPNLTIFAACRTSMFGEPSPLPNVGWSGPRKRGRVNS
jgi:hypothetical protein